MSHTPCTSIPGCLHVSHTPCTSRPGCLHVSHIPCTSRAWAFPCMQLSPPQKHNAQLPKLPAPWREPCPGGRTWGRSVLSNPQELLCTLMQAGVGISRDAASSPYSFQRGHLPLAWGPVRGSGSWPPVWPLLGPPGCHPPQGMASWNWSFLGSQETENVGRDLRQVGHVSGAWQTLPESP